MPPFPLPAGAMQPVPVDGGIYIPWTGDPAVAGDGGVAIVEVTGTRVPRLARWEMLHVRHRNCVVLSTIANYHPGDRILDQTLPPSDPIADAAAHVSRIDNRKGRRILPSVQKLLEVVRVSLPPGTPARKATPAPRAIRVQRAIRAQD